MLTAITAVCCWIAFGVNVGAGAKVKSQIKSLQSQVPAGESLEFSWGAASFLPLGAAVSTTTGLGGWDGLTSQLVVSGALVWWFIAGPPRPKESQSEVKEAEYRPSMATTDDVDSKFQ